MTQRSELCGAWHVASADEETAELYGPHVFYFSAHGELVQTDFTDAGPKRSLLTWKTRDDLLVIDQPSAPREDRVAWAVTGDGMLTIAGSRYRREPSSEMSDPDAIWWALVAAGLWHGLASVGPAPFIPFVMLETGAQRELVRIVVEDLRDAGAHVQALLQRRERERAVWVRDGYIKRGGAKLDAVLATRYGRDRAPASQHAMRYQHGPDGASTDGAALTLALPRP